MAESAVSKKVESEFNNTSPGSAVVPCCKNVKGEITKLRPVVQATDWPELEELGASDQFGVPNGLKGSFKLHLSVKIKAKIVCKCLDDGRTLGEHEYETKEFPVDFTTPQVTIVSKGVLVPAPLITALQIARFRRGMLDWVDRINKNDPDAIARLEELGGEKLKQAYDKAQAEADSYCKNKHKPCGQDPKDLTS